MSELKAKMEKRVKTRDTLCREIEATIDLLAEKTKKLTDHDLDTYHLLVDPDCLYYDSPLSRVFTWNWIKLYMIKKDLDFVGYFLDGKVAIKNFAERAMESNGWILRFSKEKEVKKIGIEAIL